MDSRFILGTLSGLLGLGARLPTCFQSRCSCKPHYSHKSLSRFGKNLKVVTLSIVEGNFLYYRICNLEANLSVMHRIVWLFFTLMDNTKKICFNRKIDRAAWVIAAFYSETVKSTC
jgi:hypothetical protein